MSKKSSAYWKKRFSDLEYAQNQYGLNTFDQIKPAFDKAERQIQAQIDTWYARYAKNNGITMTEARKQLSAAELKELKWDVQEYIKYGQENAMNQQWMKELENASARFHISRLEALKLRTQNALEVAFGNELDSLDDMTKKLYQSGYYHTCFEIQKGFRIGWEIGQIDERKLQKVISKPWAADGKNFSDRVWQSKTTMVNELHQQMTRIIIQGKAPDEAIKSMTKFLQNKTKNAKYQAGRLVMTEQAFISSAAQKDAFNDLDVEEFEIVATLDSHTSEICRKMDGQHFLMKDFELAVTAPPFHVWCRSTTVPYFGDEWGRSGERAARGIEGKTYYVPADMTYSEWKKAMVDGQIGGLKPVVSDDIIKMGILSDDSKLGLVHSDAMKTILEKAPDPVQKTWNKYADRLDVEEAHSRKGAWCNYTKGVTLDIDKVAKGEKTISRVTYDWEQAKKPYYTVFHEFGHNISSLMAKDINGLNYGDISDVFKSKKFTRAVMGKDGVEQVGYTLTQMMRHEGFTYFDSVYQKLKREAKMAGLSVRTIKKQDVWNVIRQEILEKPVLHCTDVSDMWDGISNGSCLAHYGHTNQNRKYWQSISVGTEGFAEMFSATVMNPDSVNQIKRYFPQSYELFLEILEEMGN